MWRTVLVALHVGRIAVWAQNCARVGEDCSHFGACCDGSKQCYKKDDWWAGCRSGCTPGLHYADPVEWRTPWSCTPITPEQPDCAAQEHDCAHLGCCKDAGFKCFEKNEYWAQCLQHCENDREVGLHDDPYWSCYVIHPHGGKSPPPEDEGPSPISHNLQSGLRGSHYWDCNGATCDAGVLQPWNPREYKFAPHYAPVDPANHGGAQYGEKLWMTGATSDALGDMMGPDREFCGYDDEGGGGCGQCVLVRTSDAVNSDWMAVVMKKNRCPPHSHLCERPNVHMDFAAPGFDNLQYSTANACGAGHKSETYINKQQSGICGGVTPHQCNCDQLPGDTQEQRTLRNGCRLFQAWGWTHGAPNFDYKPVRCPDAFVEWIKVGKAFNHNGVMSLYDNSTTLDVLDDSALAGQDLSGQQQWMLLGFASPFLAAGVVFAGLRARSSQTLSADSEELLELQPVP